MMRNWALTFLQKCPFHEIIYFYYETPIGVYKTDYNKKVDFLILWFRKS